MIHAPTHAATRSLPLALVSLLVVGFWLSSVAASAGPADATVVVIGARAAPVLM